MNEEIWMNADSIRSFYQNFPYDTAFAKTKTIVKMCSDDKNLYIAAICYDSTVGDYVVQSLKRDFSYPVNDGFGVYLNPYGDKINGFAFTINPYGVQREGLLQEGGLFGVTTAWDNKWFCETTETDSCWIAEIQIPFKTLRFKSNDDHWLINFSRNNLKKNENSSWVPVPRNFNIANLAYTGSLLWEELPKKNGSNISLIPYTSARSIQNFNPKMESEFDFNPGMDAKIGVTSSLNLDLSINPDFSQVNVDRQITNLSRFSIYYPERRQFFIENSDLFARFGFSRIRPFFSRQIGIYNAYKIPIYGGARLSGKLNKDWRIGVMSMQTKAVDSLGVLGENYSIFALQRQINRSNLGFIFVNRQAVDSNGISVNDYNRVFGVDYNLFSKNNKWRGKVFYHQSLSGNSSESDVKKSFLTSGTHALWLNYNTKKGGFEYNHEYIGEDYRADVGFVLRTGVYRFQPNAWYNFFTKKGPLINHGIYSELDVYFDLNGNALDRNIHLRHYYQFKNRAEASIRFNETYTRLYAEFDPSGTGKTPLPIGNYYYRNVQFYYESDFRKKFTYSFFASYGSYFNGTKFTSEATLSYRFQPYATVAVNYTQNNVHLPNPYAHTDLALIAPELRLSLNKKLFITVFTQYNQQIDNINLNARFQWRFKPMSDLFIVFTDNYLPNDFSVKNRAIVLKLNYWLNI